MVLVWLFRRWEGDGVATPRAVRTAAERGPRASSPRPRPDLTIRNHTRPFGIGTCVRCTLRRSVPTACAEKTVSTMQTHPRPACLRRAGITQSAQPPRISIQEIARATRRDGSRVARRPVLGRPSLAKGHVPKPLCGGQTPAKSHRPCANGTPRWVCVSRPCSQQLVELPLGPKPCVLDAQAVLGNTDKWRARTLATKHPGTAHKRFGLWKAVHAARKTAANSAVASRAGLPGHPTPASTPPQKALPWHAETLAPSSPLLDSRD